MTVPKGRTAISRREIEVLQLAADGCCIKLTARAMGIAINTCKVHRRNAIAFMGCTKLLPAVLEALRRGIITVPGLERAAP